MTKHIVDWVLSMIVCACILVLAGCMRTSYSGLLNESARELVDKGKRALDRDSADQALRYFVFAARQYDDKLPKDERLASARAFNNAGYVCYFMFSDYERAFDYYLSGIEIAEKEQNSFSQLFPFLYTNLANVYYVYGDYDNAMKYYKSGFEASVKENESGMATVSFYNMALSAFNLNDYGLISKEHSQFKRLAVSYDSISRYISAIADATRLREKGELSEALSVLEHGTRYIPSSPDKMRYRLSNAYMKSTLLEDMRLYPEAMEALSHIKDEVDLSDNPGASDLKIGYLQQLADLYNKLGNTDEAYSALSQYASLIDSCLSPKGFGNLKDMIRAREQKREAEDARILKNENRLMRVMLVMVMVAVLVFGTSFVVIIRQKRRLKNSYKQLYRKNQQLIEADKAGREWRKALAEVSSAQQSSIESVSCGSDAASSVDLGLVKISEKISDIFENSDEVFKSDFCLDRLALLVGESRSIVSNAINRVFGKSFFQLIGEVRVKEACRRLSDSVNYGHLTLEAIAVDCGFKSRTNFISVFKKQVGVTPSEYRKIAFENEDA